jgi:CheY-like chemotaxis protein
VAVQLLLGDDDRRKVNRMLGLLEQAGVPRLSVAVAQTGADARRFLTETKYDLLILDIAIPTRAEELADRRGGIKVLEEVSEHDIYKRPLSVVGLTGFEDLQKKFAERFHSRLWTLDYYDATSTGWVDRLKAKVKYILARSEQRESLHYIKMFV